MAAAAQHPNVEGRARRRNGQWLMVNVTRGNALDDLETRMDTQESKSRGQDQRLLYAEAYTKVVLKGFSCVAEFLRAKDQDFKLAKQAFVASFVAELRDKGFAEATHVVDAAETLLCEIPTGGQLGTIPDAVLRLQASHSGGRISYLWRRLGSTSQSRASVFRIGSDVTDARKVLARAKVRRKRGRAKASSRHRRPSVRLPLPTGRGSDLSTLLVPFWCLFACFSSI